ncbi:MAG TPA: putative folate metabolism gamma-glutamate ligase [Candidatus Wildermuthbacteria bacterium]|nr:coenzyme F420-0:L-glutamate ligase [Patescibacteria group bacterium]HEA84526.1 putative folate metabolism gamma-glutamate ligase [Candidatus Wildermuthbacteria bacterium]
MKITAIKTHKITVKDTDLFLVLDKYLPKLKEGSVVAITSKIIAICEGRVADPKDVDKDELIKREAEAYLPRSKSKYNLLVTLKNNMIVPSAGIDESNADGLYVLWPEDSQKTANKVREYLEKKFKIKNVGVVITDSRTSPLRWGVTGISLAHSGFSALNNYIGKKDIFKRVLNMTMTNVADGLAGAAVLLMGEGAEQTPLAIIEDVKFVKFQGRNPTTKELKQLCIKIEDDIYGPMLKGVKWRKGGS